MKLKNIFITVLLLAFSSASDAANINKGNLGIDGSLSLDRSTSSKTYFYTSFSGQYFLKDHFSLGGDLSFSTSSNSSSYLALGPRLSYYFYHQENVAHYVSLAPLTWGRPTSSRSSWSSSAAIGTKFFLTESVAVGPELEYWRLWSGRIYRTSDSFRLLGEFSIFL